jgi:polyphosphate kinase
MAKSRKKSLAADIRPAVQTELQRGVVAPEKYLNRELSWLEFNSRVLHEAEDPRTPLLERVNFLSIFTSNLDEFFMKRVGLLIRQVAAGMVSRKPDGLTPKQQLQAIRQKVEAMLGRRGQAYTQQILPALAQSGILILTYEQLDADQQKWAHQYFRSKVFPVLTPLSVDPGHPFPFISNLSTSLGLTLCYPDRDEKLFARVKVPEVLGQFIHLNGGNGGNGGKHQYLGLVELICRHLDELFPGMVVQNVMPFRITRNADVEQDNDDVEDLLDLVEQELRQRRFEPVVRLEVPAQPDPWMLDLLIGQLEISPQEVYQMPALLDYTILREIAQLPIRPLRYEPYSPLVPPALADQDRDIFALIRAGDLMIHHPYESFSASIERFVRSAAADPNVLAIKITLYRTGDDSPFITTLIQAAETGKQVVALVELKARFDEQRNIELAQALEKAGVHVVYGLVGLKTHTKTTLVVRQEPEGIRCYSHIGTGNYHVETAKLYTDVSLLTCRSDLADDLLDLFHFLTGRSLKRQYQRLLVAPVNMLEAFVGMIQREIDNQKAGKPARIVAKMNSLEAQEVVEALYRASQEGVPVDLLVRGFCCLRPGLPGLSQNIRVISVIGRFLEHSRIFHFANGQADPLAGQFYIGSADWMYRNLLGRVEVITPVEDPTAKARLWEILQVMLKDQRQAWDMQSDGSYIQRTPAPGSAGPETLGTHALLMALTRQAAQSAAERPR